MDGKIAASVPTLGGSTISTGGYSSGWGNSYSFKNDVTSYKINEISNVDVESIDLSGEFSDSGLSSKESENISGSQMQDSSPGFVVKAMKDSGAKLGIARTKWGEKVENLLNLKKGDPDLKDLHIEPVYSSWFGIQNEEMWKLITGGAAKGLEALPNKLLQKQMDKRWNDDNKDYGQYATGMGKMGEFFDNVNQTNRQLQDDLAMNAEGYDKDYQLGKKQKFKNINIQVLGVKWSGALLDTGEKTANTAVGDFSGRVRVGYCDAAASVSVGPGHIGAEASATFGLLKAEGKYSSPKLKTESGVELLSFDSNASVSVCEGSAKARALVGGYYEKDENGKTVHHFEAGVSLNAEANLFKATASGQVNVFGIGLGGELTFKVGVGAKIDAGYIDGKLHFKIALAAGIGFEIGFSIDLGGFIDNVCILADGAKEAILGVVDDACEWAEGIWEDVINSDFVQDVVEVAEDVGSWGVWPWNWF